MVQSISHYFAEKLASNSEEQEVLQYGFECLINTLIPTIIYIIFALTQNIIFEALIWFVLFLLLRNYIGGYHASSHGKCIAISIIYGLLTLFFINNCRAIPLLLEISVCLIIAISHLIFGPIINDVDLIANYKKYKIIGFSIIITESALILVFNFYNVGIHSCLFFSLISAALLHYIERIKRWGMKLYKTHM